ncbi:hypothetical protein REH65_24760 [Saccharopolyspora sp. ID03-671]|uniref:hypothetical protein n=1 Tax=Saccharopolyspora sp. ID03-671 TaxID=3073066 RepID=UPI00324AEB67
MKKNDRRTDRLSLSHAWPNLSGQTYAPINLFGGIGIRITARILARDQRRLALPQLGTSRRPYRQRREIVGAGRRQKLKSPRG